MDRTPPPTWTVHCSQQCVELEFVSLLRGWSSMTGRRGGGGGGGTHELNVLQGQIQDFGKGGGGGRGPGNC